MDEQELQQAVRAGLERHATEADVSAPVAARARAAVSRRRRTRWSVGAAAAAVVLVVGGVAIATRGDGDRGTAPPVVDNSSSDVRPSGVTEWRTEYWGGVAVDVPADWGYGTVPYSHDHCAQYPGAVFDADGTRLRGEERAIGYVGRPIAIEDVCAIDYLDPPEGPVVWFDADDAFADLGDETVEIAGVTVTVAGDDVLRDQILSSVRPAEETICDATLRHVARGSWALIDVDQPSLEPYAWVCAYRLAEDGSFTLSYAAEIDPAAAESAYSAQDEAPDQRVDCDYQPLEFVVLKDGVTGSAVRQIVYETGCAGGTVSMGAGVVKQMVPEGVEPWAHNGIPAVVYGPTGGKGAMIDSFIGQLG